MFYMRLDALKLNYVYSIYKCEFVCVCVTYRRVVDDFEWVKIA